MHANPPPTDDPRHRLALWLMQQLSPPKAGQPEVSDRMMMHLMVGILLLLMMQRGPTIGGLLRCAFAAGRLYGRLAERIRARGS